MMVAGVLLASLMLVAFTSATGAWAFVVGEAGFALLGDLPGGVRLALAMWGGGGKSLAGGIGGAGGTKLGSGIGSAGSARKCTVMLGMAELIGGGASGFGKSSSKAKCKAAEIGISQNRREARFVCMRFHRRRAWAIPCLLAFYGSTGDRFVKVKQMVAAKMLQSFAAPSTNMLWRGNILCNQKKLL